MLLSSTLLACATAPEDEFEPAEYQSAGSDCISEGTIRNYKVLNDSNLVVTALAKRQYHIKLGRRAMGLQSAWSIGFTSVNCSSMTASVLTA